MNEEERTIPENECGIRWRQADSPAMFGRLEGAKSTRKLLQTRLEETNFRKVYSILRKYLYIIAFG